MTDLGVLVSVPGGVKNAHSPQTQLTPSAQSTVTQGIVTTSSHENSQTVNIHVSNGVDYNQHLL